MYYYNCDTTITYIYIYISMQFISLRKSEYACCPHDGLYRPKHVVN
jgi:hypothetical protein